MLNFRLGEWITAKGRTGWIYNMGYGVMQVKFSDAEQIEWVNSWESESNEKILPEVKAEAKKVFIDIALDMGDFKWLRELGDAE